MREFLLQKTASVTCKRPVSVLLFFSAITLIMASFAGKISIETSWSALIPKDHPAQESFAEILDTFGTATQIIAVIEGPDEEKIKQAAQELALTLDTLTAAIPSQGKKPGIQKVLKRVRLQYDTSFIANHGFMLIKAKDLDKQKHLFTDYNLTSFLRHTNDILESEYVSDSDNLTKQEKEATRFLDGFYRLFDTMHLSVRGTEMDTESIQSAVNAVTTGDGYYLSTDRKMLLMFLTPIMSIDEIDATVAGVNAIDIVLSGYEETHPDIRTGMTGMHVITRDEMVSGMSDTVNNLIMALIIIFAVFAFSFRMLSGPILAMIVLIVGIIWDIGIAYLVIGRLNIFTAICSVILMGLGVDYAIHLLSSYSEFRFKGLSREEAFLQTFTNIGPGLITGAMTTAAAFLSLTFTSFAAFQEFGFVISTGIAACLVTTLFLLPSIIVIKEKLSEKIRTKKPYHQIDMSFKTLGHIASFSHTHRRLTLAASLAATAVFLYFIPDVKMNKNYMDMEPEGLESVRLQREIPKRFSISADNMMAIIDSLPEVNRLQDELNEKPSIGMVESIAEYLPSRERQERSKPFVRMISDYQNTIPPSETIHEDSLITELYRFSDNLTEMSSLAFIGGLDRVFRKTNQFLGLNEDGDQIEKNRAIELAELLKTEPEALRRMEGLQREFIPRMKERVSAMADTAAISMEIIPEELRQQYVSADGDKYLMILYAHRDIWDGLFTSPYLETITRDIPNASGTPVLMKAMITRAKEEGAFAFLLSFASFIIILYADFRRIKLVLTALFPLVISIVWMIGIMGLTGFPFSIVNVIGLPLILGIGIDDGVHILHRHRIEGGTRLFYTYSSIGKAIFLTTLTTVLAFGSLVPSMYRGYASLGILACMGIGLCLFTSIFILPALLGFIDKK